MKVEYGVISYARGEREYGSTPADFIGKSFTGDFWFPETGNGSIHDTPPNTWVWALKVVDNIIEKAVDCSLYQSHSAINCWRNNVEYDPRPWA
ncbi:hypothetical protein EKK58_10645 [Candidatus Dependentiae bacterium]|nr:MAG: hypothetical protein EKK58_10645 [Candidatus Dependentiae bacterium]